MASLKGIIIGFGNMGQTHWQRYRDLEVEIVAVVDPLPLINCDMVHYENCSEIPDNLKFDFIDICSPTYLHFSHLQKSLRYDVPIFIEKPVVTRREEIDYLSQLSHSCLIFVGEVEQYNPAFSPFLNYQGAVERIEITRQINLEFFLSETNPWFLDENLSGGIVFDAMIHDLNLLVGKYGVPALKSVEGHSQKFNCIDSVKATLTRGNIQMDLNCCWTASFADPPIKTSLILFHNNQNVLTIRCNNYHIKNQPPSKDAFHQEILAFLTAIRENQVPIPLSKYLEALLVAEQLKQKLQCNYEQAIASDERTSLEDICFADRLPQANTSRKCGQ